MLISTGVLSCVFAASALAQTASPPSQVGPGATPAAGADKKAIGPAAANTPQDHILTGALSPHTRQTLQEAMDSARGADTAHPAPPAK